MTQDHQGSRPPGRVVWLFATSLALALSSCNKQAPPPESQPPPVTIAKPVQKEIIEWDYYTGRTEAVESVNVTPRVSGYIDNITFRAGDRVHKGDLLWGQAIHARILQILHNPLDAGAHAFGHGGDFLVDRLHFFDRGVGCGGEVLRVRGNGGGGPRQLFDGRRYLCDRCRLLGRA